MTPRPWRPGDPVGCGEVFLPTRKLVEAYTQACVDAQIETAARAICAMPDRETRAAAVAMYYAPRRERLKEKIRELWAKR